MLDYLEMSLLQQIKEKNIHMNISINAGKLYYMVHMPEEIIQKIPMWILQF